MRWDLQFFGQAKKEARVSDVESVLKVARRSEIRLGDQITDCRFVFTEKETPAGATMVRAHLFLARSFIEAFCPGLEMQSPTMEN